MQTEMATINYGAFADNVRVFQRQFRDAKYIKYFVIDGILNEDVAQKAALSFPPYESMEHIRQSVVEERACETRLSHVAPIFHQIFADLRSSQFTAFIESVTGIKGLSTSAAPASAQLHQSRNGGFHAIHLDSNCDRTSGYFNRLSLVLYLGESPEDPTNGSLTFWDRDARFRIGNVPATRNRCVIFEVHDHAYHGYDAVALPPSVTRKSLAISYQTPEPGELQTDGPRHVVFRAGASKSIAQRLIYSARKLYFASPTPVQNGLKGAKATVKRLVR